MTRVKNSYRAAFVFLLLVFSIGLFNSNLGQANNRRVNGPHKVRLVLGVVIDQFRYDYLTRFEDLFGPGGFRRLLNEGAVFTNANYSYVPTVTACGHATFMTGSLPSLHGIIGNEWFDRETGKRINNVDDSSVKPLGGQDVAPASPRRLIGSTLGDQMKLSNVARSKVVGIALKDRAAILPAGKKANGAYWYDMNTGEFISSTYYFPELPEWVKRFNQTNRVDKYFGARWEKLLPDSAYQRSLPDDSSYEKYKYGNKFPHIINGGESKPGKSFYSQFDESPFANEYELAFAKAAIEGEGLGQDEYTDLLTVSFSANDIMAHYFGPYSQEVEDMTLRTDLVLADLFRYVDQKVGLANTLIVLTSDHGVAPIVEHAADMGLGGGRVDLTKITKAVDAALDDRFGQENWILDTVNGNIYFDYEAIARRHAERSEVELVGKEAVLKIEGIADCFTRSQLLSGQFRPGMISTRVNNGFNAQRNGDLVYVLKPFYITRLLDGTNHGTPYSYDTHVPVIFFGSGFAPGSYAMACTPSDIAPTLATLLKIEPPSNAVGRVLTEAFRSSVQR
jgi:predicted AlkP superfamily pyrophosphatase or phosphodiesterase